MKIVKYKGGLGNQLFQYAFARLLELKYGVSDILSDFTYYENITNDNIRQARIQKLDIKYQPAEKIDLKSVCILAHNTNPTKLFYKIKLFIEKEINKDYYFEKDRSYIDPAKILNYKYFDGYWQSWRYLKEIERHLRNEIRPLDPMSEKTLKTIDEIRKRNAVFLGVRRGDYLANRKMGNHFGSFNQDYFDKAIEIIKKHVEDPVLFIFSNDIEWVKKNLVFDCDTIYRENIDQVSDLEELFIMSSCKHAVIVNSTFYWWGAWLINNPNKVVIAPKNWFADGSPIEIVPEDWFKI
jgi:hypothetical protein